MQFESFDSVEDMFAAMQANEEAANATLAPEQQALTWGSHFVNFIPAQEIVVFGYCFTKEEAFQSEYDASPPEEREAGWPQETVNHLASSLARGYLFGRCYSVIEPEGELGSTHKSQAWPIAPGLFQLAQRVGWRIDRLDPLALAALDNAYQARRAHALRQQ